MRSGRERRYESCARLNRSTLLDELPHSHIVVDISSSLSGNPVPSGGSRVSCIVEGPDEEGIDVDVVDDGAEATFTYVPLLDGPHLVSG